MVSFMVLGGARCATTWTSQLLTTDHTLCLHDPLVEYTTAALDNLTVPGKRLGIADTSALYWDKWLEDHPAKKIVLWRDPAEINASLRELGSPEMDIQRYMQRCARWPREQLYHWQSVFHAPAAEEICGYLGVPFCRYRFRELVKVNIQPEWSRLAVSKEAVRDMMRQVAEFIS